MQPVLVPRREPRLKKRAMEVPREAVLASSVEWLEPAQQAAMAQVGVPVSRFLLAEPLSCQLVPMQVQ